MLRLLRWSWRPALLRKRWICRPAAKAAVLRNLASSSNSTFVLTRGPVRGCLAPVDVTTPYGPLLVARTDIAVLSDLYSDGLIEWPDHSDGGNVIWPTIEGIIRVGDRYAH
jgi:hypothetical protein